MTDIGPLFIPTNSIKAFAYIFHDTIHLKLSREIFSPVFTVPPRESAQLFYTPTPFQMTSVHC